MIEISTEQRTFYLAATQALKGSEQGCFMASVVLSFGRGGQRYAERVFGWHRRTVRKGIVELTSGICQADPFAARGRNIKTEK
jgi:hypothetical protein